MKKLFLLAAAAAVFAACSDKDELAQQTAPVQPLEEGAVGFDAYLERTVTRAGETGDIALAQLKEGFGVFGFYTDNRDYDQLAIPNFFYNQKVAYNDGTSAWTYSPVKYWPNEYGNDAVSEDADRVSYFAYAPFQDVDPASGKVDTSTDPTADTWGITSITRNTAGGDPIIKYIASFNSKKAVDLCWGTVPNDPQYTTWLKVSEAQTQSFTAGKPWLDVQRPGQVDQRVKFQFKHALAKMKVSIDYLADIYQEGETPNTIDATETKIWVRQVRFSGFTMKGSLNLNNEDAGKPYWMNYNCVGDLVSDGMVTLYDGRKDGKEGQADAVATNEKTLGLNPQLLQDDKQLAAGAWSTSDDDARTGVPSSLVNLFEDEVGGSGIFYVIPTDDDLEIEIVYDVETINGNLAGTLADGKTHGSNIPNTITQKITFGNGEKSLNFGKAYELKLHLGMNSVKFDADVMGWDDMEPLDVDLPSNLPRYAASTSPASITVPYSATSFTFGITGLNGGENVAAAAGKNKWNTATGTATETTSDEYIKIDESNNWSGNTANALSNGTFVAKLTTNVNPTTSNRTQTVTWTGAQSTQALTVNFTQLAHPLHLYTGTEYGADNTASITGSKLTLKRDDAFASNAYGWFCKGLTDNCAVLASNGDPDATTPTNGIAVYRNGHELTWVESSDDPIPAKSYTFGDTSGEITFGEAPQVGDIIKVVLKTGDAPVETISIKVIATPTPDPEP